MLSFVLNNQEHVIHFMFIIQVKLSRDFQLFAIVSTYVKNLIFFDCDVDFFFFFFSFRYINRRVRI